MSGNDRGKPEGASEGDDVDLDVLIPFTPVCARLTAQRRPTMRTMLFFLAAGLMWGGLASAQPQYPTAEVPTSEPAYLAKVKTAAPELIVSKATIIMMQEGKPRELQAGSNGFTCLITPDGTPACADRNG